MQMDLMKMQAKIVLSQSITTTEKDLSKFSRCIANWWFLHIPSLFYQPQNNCTLESKNYTSVM
jgi:tetraacyldisaccharide-1-P 4'-kinase